MPGPRSSRSSFRSRRVVAGTPFNLMICGQSLTGKSSLIRTLIDSLASRRIVADVAAVLATPGGGGGAGSAAGAVVATAAAGATSAPISNSGSTADLVQAGSSSSSSSSSSGAASPAIPNSSPLQSLQPQALRDRTLSTLSTVSSAVAPNTPVLLSAIFPADDINAPAPVRARIDFEEEGGERISLRLIDTPGLPIPVNIHKLPPAVAEMAAIANAWVSPIVAYLETQYQTTLLEETKVKRNPKSPDHQVHACLYLLDPQTCLASKGLTAVDRIALRRLCTRVNVIPCIGKSDLLTSTQLKTIRTLIMDDFRRSEIPIYAFPDDSTPENEAVTSPANSINGAGGPGSVTVDEDEDTAALNAALRSLLPFAIVNDEELDPSAMALMPTPASSAILANSTAPLRHSGGSLGRVYAWGTVECENPDHCDFVSLKTAIFGSHLDELKTLTRELYYEQWRTEKLMEVRGSMLMKASASNAGSTAGESNKRRNE